MPLPFLYHVISPPLLRYRSTLWETLIFQWLYIMKSKFLVSDDTDTDADHVSTYLLMNEIEN